MTAHKVVIMKCDGCGTTALPPGMILSDLVHMAVPAPDGVVEARRDARLRGWIHGANGKDLCSTCRGTDAPPPVKRLLDHIPHPHWGHH